MPDAGGASRREQEAGGTVGVTESGTLTLLGREVYVFTREAEVEAESAARCAWPEIIQSGAAAGGYRSLAGSIPRAASG